MQNQQNTQPGQYTFPISGYTTPYTTTPTATEPSQSQPGAYQASASTAGVPGAGTSAASGAPLASTSSALGTSGALGTSSAPGTSSAAPGSSSAPGPSRQQAEEARKDRTLAEFLLMLDDYEPLVCPSYHGVLLHADRFLAHPRADHAFFPSAPFPSPPIEHALPFLNPVKHAQIPNEVTDYYLQRVGFECEDVRLKRLLSLAAQKFVADIAGDAYQHARIRTNAAGARGRTAAPYGMSKDKTRTTLTMDDLSAALSEYGIDARKPDFYL
ncbi:transcription initiation factor TFIID 23-30kDa subunit-domain-containing protein [Schizophyllum commune]